MPKNLYLVVHFTSLIFNRKYLNCDVLSKTNAASYRASVRAKAACAPNVSHVPVRMNFRLVGFFRSSHRDNGSRVHRVRGRQI